MPRQIDALNGLDRDALIVLYAYDSATGADVRRELEAYYGITLNSSRVYQALNRLNQEGYLDKHNGKGVQKPYAITESGRGLVGDHVFWATTMTGSIDGKNGGVTRNVTS